LLGRFHGMMMLDGKEEMDMDNCGHEGCKCQVSGGEQYCSDHCREHGPGPGTGQPCGCGHPLCQQA
jgi:hypothetical protein